MKEIILANKLLPLKTQGIVLEQQLTNGRAIHSRWTTFW